MPDSWQTFAGDQCGSLPTWREDSGSFSTIHTQTLEGLRSLVAALAQSHDLLPKPSEPELIDVSGSMAEQEFGPIHAAFLAECQDCVDGATSPLKVNYDDFGTRRRWPRSNRNSK